VELRIGSTVGPYVVESFVAEGGMSLIYKVRHREEDTLHALKVLAVHTRSVRERMQQEGQLQRLLHHPNIVSVTDVLQLPHAPALVMDFVAGPDLADLLARCSLTDTQTDHLARGILHGLIAAHANGMVHRDLKPSNIMIEIGDGVLTPRITDFGLAKMWSTDDDRPLTHSGTAMGTPSYMAPEQIWDASGVDERADVFSLGAVLYEMLSGKRAFAGANNVDVWSRITSGTRELLDALRPDLPAKVVRAVHWAMATDPDQRAPDMQSLLKKWEEAWASASEESPLEDVWRGTVLDEAQKLAAERSQNGMETPSSSVYSDEASTTLYGYVDDESPNSAVATDIVEISTPIQQSTLSFSTPRPGNLPEQGDRFIGRSVELKEVESRVQSGCSVLTLAGPGGMGKTRLSLKFGEQNRAQYPGGVWFCDLTAAQNESDIIHAVAQSLGVPLREKNPELQLAHAIHGRGRVLIILDNLEQVVVHAATTVGLWAQQAPQAHFIVTSRIQMGLQAEQVYELGPINTEEGIELFVERASHLRSGYALAPDERAVVAEIVERVDGMSLAIELAAARTQMLRPHQILERLDQRFRLLSSGRRDQTGRQSTLSGAIDWSWDLLSDVERSALAQCSVFRGGFTLQAAEEVIDLQPWTEWPMDVVQRLVQQSLIRSTEPTPGHIRFQLYASIREYAQDKLSTSGAVTTEAGEEVTGPGAVAAIGRRHCAFYAQLGTEDVLEKRFWGALPDVREAFCLERDNLAQAIAFGPHSPPAHHAQVTVAWAAIYRWGGPFLPALAVVKDTMKRTDFDPRSQLQLAEAAGQLHHHVNQHQQAADYAKECIELARILRDPGAQGRALSRSVNNRGPLLSVEQVLAAHEEALVLLRDAEDIRGELNTLWLLGNFYTTQDNADAAESMADEMLEKSLTAGCLWLEARSLRFRANWYMDAGHLDLAEQDLKRAAELAQRIKKPMLSMEVNGSLGTLYKDLGRLDESVERHEVGIQICREVGDKKVESILMNNLALVLQLQGKDEDAVQMYKDTLLLTQNGGLGIIGHIARGNMGDVFLTRGKLEESIEHLSAAVKNLDSMQPSMAGAFRGSLAWAQAQRGHIDVARELLEEGDAQLRGVWVVELGRLLCRRAQVEWVADCPEKAQAALAEAKEIAATLGGSEDSDLGQMLSEAERMLQG